MKYSLALGFVFASLFTAILGQTPNFDPIKSPASGQRLRAGQNFDIVWEPSGAPNDATITIKLLQGKTPQTLQVGMNVGSHVPNNVGRYTWAVPQSLGSHETYGFIISLDNNPSTFQYSFPFGIDGENESNAPAPGQKPSEEPDFPPDDEYSENGDKDHDDSEHDSGPQPTSSGSSIVYPTGGSSYHNSTDSYSKTSDVYTSPSTQNSPSLQTSTSTQISYYIPTSYSHTNPSAPYITQPTDPKETHPLASDALSLSWNGLAILGCLALSSMSLMI